MNRDQQQAETMTLNANNIMREAIQKETKAESYIRQMVAKNTAKIKHDSDKKLKLAIRKQEDKYFYSTCLLGYFSFVMVVAYAINMRHILATIPQWFDSRLEDIEGIFSLIKDVYFDIYNTSPMSGILNHLTAILIVGIILLSVLLVFMVVIFNLDEWNKKKWKEYRVRGDIREKYGFTAFLGAASLQLSLVICDIWKQVPINFISIFLVFFAIFYGLYHSRSNIEYHL